MFKWLKNLFKNKEIIFCKDCRWCIPSTNTPTPLELNPKWEYAKCNSPLNLKKEKLETHKLYTHKLYLVGDGELNRPKRKRITYCSILRDISGIYGGGCGKKGRWFEPMVAPQNLPDKKVKL